LTLARSSGINEHVTIETATCCCCTEARGVSRVRGRVAFVAVSS